MPPKKKSRVPMAADADTPGAPSTPGPTSTIATPLAPEPVLSDGWTDEQEITLFKAIAVYRWKPAGMHKHFRMLSITQLMRNHGVFDTHTTPRGIWAKLNTLYNLEGLDEREDMPDDESEGVGAQGWADFRLPEEEFGELMASRRLNPEGTASPGQAAGVRRRRVSESVKSVKGAKSAAAAQPPGSEDGGDVGKASEDEESVARSSPVSQRSGPRKRAAGASRLSVVRGTVTPRGGRQGARGGGAVGMSTKKIPVGMSARRKGKVQQESSEEEEQASSSEGDGSGSDAEENSGSGEEGSRSEGLSGSTQEEEEDEGAGSGDEDEDGDEDGGEDGDEEEEEEEGQTEEGEGSPEVSTPRGGAAGGRRSSRGGGGGAVKTPAKRGGRKVVDSSVRRSARKK